MAEPRIPSPGRPATSSRNPDPRLDWLRLANTSWIGATVRAGLVRRFGNPTAIFRADRPPLNQVQGWTPERLERFLLERDRLEPLCPPELLDRKGIRLLTMADAEYPEALRQIPDAPVVLFCLGKGRLTAGPALALVGARQGSQMGFDIARDFARDLSRAGFTIISGLALGVDTFAHLGALEGSGATVAVLGCGPDVVYPTGNRKVRERLLEQGLIVSEYPPGTPARPWHFPVRNRVISGLAVGTVVIEATARSGSLITARLAAEQNRDVFAIPGPIRSALAQGTLDLIKEGATLVTTPRQLVEHFAHLLPVGAETSVEDEPDLTADEIRLVRVLSPEPLSLDRLLADGRWPRDQLFSLLLTLEMRDVLVKLPGNFYQSKIKPPVGR